MLNNSERCIEGSAVATELGGRFERAAEDVHGVRLLMKPAQTEAASCTTP